MLNTTLFYCLCFCFTHPFYLFVWFAVVFSLHIGLLFQLCILEVRCHSILCQFSQQCLYILPFANDWKGLHESYSIFYWVFNFPNFYCYISELKGQWIGNNSLFCFSQKKIFYRCSTFIHHQSCQTLSHSFYTDSTQ